jgi:acyl-CoA thioester hydrolase
VFSGDRCIASAQATTVLVDQASRKPVPLTDTLIDNFQRWMLRETAAS